MGRSCIGASIGLTLLHSFKRTGRRVLAVPWMHRLVAITMEYDHRNAVCIREAARSIGRLAFHGGQRGGQVASRRVRQAGMSAYRRIQIRIESAHDGSHRAARREARNIDSLCIEMMACNDLARDSRNE